MSHKFAVILGTRAEITKMAPVIRELESEQAEFFILHTGQHYSYNLDGIFFEQLKLPPSRYNLEVGSGTHGEQTARILTGVEKVLIEESPDTVLVLGDTNSVLAGALAATKLHIKVGHIEAGLRSYDRTMPEETNRTLTDHCSDYLFAPTEPAKIILLGEGIPEDRIFVTGNTIVDTVQQNLGLAGAGESTLESLGIKSGEYILATVHRQENIENRERFSSILEGMERVGAEFNLPVIYPVHPHSRKTMTGFDLESPGLTLIEPVDFLSFLQLEQNARLILTDSGGVQEEACILKVPCVTMRDNTERPETVEVGANLLAGVSPENIVKSAREMLAKDNNWLNPLGDGKAAERIVRIITGA
ncbi:MAG: UDP-N-acetylglucosamine 2-epimerase (non-hydrolyzing) [Dehalococcoidales bacterium]